MRGRGALSEDILNRFGARKREGGGGVVIKEKLKLCLSANLFFFLVLGFHSNGNKCCSSIFLSPPLAPSSKSTGQVLGQIL